MTSGPYKSMRNFPNAPAGARWTQGSITRCGRCVYFVEKTTNPDRTTQGKCFIDRPKERHVHGGMVCPRFFFNIDPTADYGWEEGQRPGGLHPVVFSKRRTA